MGKEKLSQYVVGYNDSWDTMLKRLIEYLDDNNIIESDSKWAFTNFSIMRTLFDYGYNVITDTKNVYTSKRLKSSIKEHEKIIKKFEELLLKFNESKKKEKEIKKDEDDELIEDEHE